MRYIKTFENIHDRWEQQSIEEEDIKQFSETLFVNLLDEGFTIDTNVIYSEYSQDPNKYLRVYVRYPHASIENVVKYSNISNEIYLKIFHFSLNSFINFDVRNNVLLQ